MSGIALILPDSISIRNMVFGRVVDRLAGPKLLLHGMPDSTVAALRDLTGSAEWIPLAQHRERALAFGLRQSLAYAQMYWANTRSMQFNRRRRVGGSWKTRLAAGTARLVGQMAASPASIRALELAYCRSVASFPEVAQYRALFAKHRPSLVFCANQRSPQTLPVVLAAHSMGIPTATFIVSWDNLTSKGRIAAPFQHYLVWSDNMRKELLRYYPHISHSRIHIVGTPQFDCYGDPGLLMTREQFCAQLGADPARKLICYSGGDRDTSPEDQEHVRIILEQIRSGEIHGNPQLVLRPCPVDDGKRYDRVRAEFPELIYAPPQWEHLEPGNWARCMPSREDMRMLANITVHADVNVNLASTMTLDYAIHDRPVVNVAFDVGVCPPGDVPLWNHYYQWEHYKPIVQIGAARFATSRAELAEHLNAYLRNPALDRAARKKLVDFQLGVPVGQSAARIAEVLARIAA